VSSPSPEAAFERIARLFAKDPRVTRGGKGFGSTGLKVDGKLFAFVSSRNQFVVKLPKARVDALVAGAGFEYFDAGKGRPMKEWAATGRVDESWARLAREARRFVGVD
jgi:TfoX/Sxy family transcriptional regulator of competence genes